MIFQNPEYCFKCVGCGVICPKPKPGILNVVCPRTNGWLDASIRIALNENGLAESYLYTAKDGALRRHYYSLEEAVKLIKEKMKDEE